MARVITVGNRKGGSGKTTTAVSLAAALAHRGRNVLLVDLDPQAHATLSLGVRDLGGGGVYATLAQGKTVRETAMATYHPSLRLLPGSRRLSEYERLYTPLRDARQRMVQALAPVQEVFDYVVVDTPPTLGLLTVSALIASSDLVVPMQAHFLALDGLAEMIRMVETINRIYKTGLRIRGVVPTFYQVRARLTRAVLEDVRAHLGPEGLLPPVRSCIALAEAPSHGETIFKYSPLSTGAVDYNAVVAQIDGAEPSPSGKTTQSG